MVHRSQVTDSIFSPDGETIVTTTDQMWTVQLWDSRTGLPIGSPCEPEGRGPRWACSLVSSSSPDGKTVAVRRFFEGKVHLLDARTGMPIGNPLAHQDHAVSVAFSPDSKMIVTSDDKMAMLWDIATAQPLGQPMFHEVALRSATFLADGTAVLTEGEDGTAWIWNVRTGQPMGQPLEMVHLVGSVMFSAMGRALQTTSGYMGGSFALSFGDPQPACPCLTQGVTLQGVLPSPASLLTAA